MEKNVLMPDIVLATAAPIAIRFSAKGSGRGARLDPGYCTAVCEGEIQVSDEPHYLARCIRPGRCISNRIRHFRCCIRLGFFRGIAHSRQKKRVSGFG